MGGHNAVAAGLLGLILALGTGACGDGTATGHQVRPPVLGSVDGVPPSTTTRVLALPGGVACTPDTYLVRIHCFAVVSGAAWSFGREGAGPGELEVPGPLLPVQGADSVLAVMDLDQWRIELFTATGRYLRGGRAPFGFWPFSAVRSGRVVGALMPTRPPQATDEHTGRLAVVDLAGDGHTEAQLRTPREAGEEEALAFARGAWIDDSTAVLHVAGHRFSAHGLDGRLRYAFGYPQHLRVPIYPSDRDLEHWANAFRKITGRPPPAAQLEARAEVPLSPVLQGTNPVVGPGASLWVASPRERLERSYIDVFRAGAFLGTVVIRHRLLDLSITGDTLVALVVRPDSADSAPAGLDWYDAAAALAELEARVRWPGGLPQSRAGEHAMSRP